LNGTTARPLKTTLQQGNDLLRKTYTASGRVIISRIFIMGLEYSAGLKRSLTTARSRKHFVLFSKTTTCYM
jgi:hypothetical protein